MKSIVFFNNKGGVGKTTLVCNLISYINQNKGKRALLIDADPQCNATQSMLGDKECESLYLTTKGKIRTDSETLYKSLKLLEVGEPTIDTDITPFSGSENRFCTDLIPGHPRVSVVEDRLSDAWSDLRGVQVRGFRITSWPRYLIKKYENSYDYIFFDVGPSLGALNRSIILSCDGIVTPFGCDIFSIFGIQNISSWIEAWSKEYDRAIEGLRQTNESHISDYDILENIQNNFRFVGFSVQQYLKRKFKTGHRPVKSYDKIMVEIPSVVEETMGFLKDDKIPWADVKLGDIPYLHSLVPLAQSARVPIHGLTSGDGLVGAHYKSVESYRSFLDVLCDRFLKNTSQK